MLERIKFSAFIILVLSIFAFVLQMEGTRRVRHTRSGQWVQPHGYPWRANMNAWNSSWVRWPQYYAYYGYPIAASNYYYSFPTNTSFFYSYPSTYADWTYPSYPFVGKFYTNQTPFYPGRARAPYLKMRRRGYFRPSPRPSISPPVERRERAKTGVFFDS